MAKVTLDESGIATETGDITIYNYSEKTGTLISACNFYILIGSGVPAYSTTLSPPVSPDHTVAIFVNGDWQVVEDHRNQMVYSITDRTSTIVDYVGEIKEGYTNTPPKTSFDEWKEGLWVTNTANQKLAQLAEVTSKRDVLLLNANSEVVPLQYAIDLGEETEAEASLLKQWKKYIVALNRLDLSLAPDIIWPERP